MLIHAGDLSWNGSEEEIADFIEWFRALNYRHKSLSQAIMTIVWMEPVSKGCRITATIYATAV